MWSYLVPNEGAGPKKDAEAPGNGAVFERSGDGPDAPPDAVPASGKFPLIVASHGQPGTCYRFAYLNAHLASQGFMECVHDLIKQFASVTVGVRLETPK